MVLLIEIELTNCLWLRKILTCLWIDSFAKVIHQWLSTCIVYIMLFIKYYANEHFYVQRGQYFLHIERYTASKQIAMYDYLQIRMSLICLLFYKDNTKSDFKTSWMFVIFWKAMASKLNAIYDFYERSSSLIC